MNGPSWNLRLLGEFELRDPRGEPVVIPHRKVQGLLAMLVWAGPDGVSRNLLQQRLWPEDSTSHRQLNLRQVLFQLKRALGEGALTITRTRCRLADGFSVSCDALSTDAKGTGSTFLPDHWEPWFCSIRNSLSFAPSGKAAGVAASTVGPVDSFARLLKWTSERSPQRTVDLLRGNLDLADGLAPKEINPILDRALQSFRPDDPLYGWVVFWKGKQRFNADIDSLRPWIHRAIALAQSSADEVLEAEAIYWLGVAEIITGRIGVADRLSRMAEALAAKRVNRHLAARAADLAAHVRLHQGNPGECLRLLGIASELYGDNLALTSNVTALMALYEAIGGSIDQAERLLELPEREYPEGDHVALGLICGLARGHIALRANELDRAATILDNVVDRAASASSEHFEVYAREALADTRWRQREKSAAAGHLGSSNRMRKRLKMKVTAWDRLRLSGLPVSYH